MTTSNGAKPKSRARTGAEPDKARHEGGGPAPGDGPGSSGRGPAKTGRVGSVRPVGSGAGAAW